MSDYSSSYVTKQILASEDHTYKSTILKRYTNEIASLDQQFLKLVKDIIFEEDSRGKVITAIENKADEQFKKNTMLLETADTRITKIVQKFDEQVDDMKTQSMTIYYEIIPSD
jgi:hypothetical protein